MMFRHCIQTKGQSYEDLSTIGQIYKCVLTHLNYAPRQTFETQKNQETESTQIIEPNKPKNTDSL